MTSVLVPAKLRLNIRLELSASRFGEKSCCETQPATLRVCTGLLRRMMASTTTISRSGAPTRRRQQPNDAPADVALEKDETELRLEKALFGDDAGFLAALTTQRWRDGGALQRTRTGSHEDSDEAVEKEDLAEVPDEEVCLCIRQEIHC